MERFFVIVSFNTKGTTFASLPLLDDSFRKRLEISHWSKSYQNKDYIYLNTVCCSFQYQLETLCSKPLPMKEMDGPSKRLTFGCFLNSTCRKYRPH